MDYVFITGATGVMGKAFAKEYAKKGYNLYLTGRNLDKLCALCEELNCFGVQIKISPCDMGKLDSIENLKSEITKENLSFSHLILVAGNDNQMGFSEYEQDKILSQISTNYTSPVVLSKFFIEKYNVKNILVISSLTAIVPMPYFAIYSSSKRAVADFFLAIRREYRDKNITVVMPGSVPTRPDVIEDIKKQGLTGKLSSQPVEKIVTKSVKALYKNKKILVVGIYNKALYFFSKFIPLTLKQKMVEKKFKNKRKENF